MIRKMQCQIAQDLALIFSNFVMEIKINDLNQKGSV